MKIKVTRSTQIMYTDNRTIELEIPDGTEDIEAFVKEYIDENIDEVEDEFMDADLLDEYGDPDHIFYTVKADKGEIQWKDY